MANKLNKIKFHNIDCKNHVTTCPLTYFQNFLLGYRCTVESFYVFNKLQAKLVQGIAKRCIKTISFYSEVTYLIYQWVNVN